MRIRRICLLAAPLIPVLIMRIPMNARQARESEYLYKGAGSEHICTRALAAVAVAAEHSLDCIRVLKAVSC